MEESAPREQWQGAQRIFAKMNCGSAGENSSAPQNALLHEMAQSSAERGFKNEHPERGRKLLARFRVVHLDHEDLRTSTPKGDGNQ